MLRCTFFLFACLLLLATSDDVEITEDEPSQPTFVETVSPLDDGDFIGSSDVDALLAFIEPPLGLSQSTGPISLTAGKPSSIIVSLENTNVGSSPNSYTLTSIESALHYPHYYRYYLQNFTTKRLHTVLEPSQQVSIAYSFTPSVQLASQQFDLAVIVNYHDQNGKPYSHSLFNNTIALLENDEGMDTELIFLGVLVLSLGLLFVLGLWHWFTKKTHKLQRRKSTESHSLDESNKNEYVVQSKKPLNKNDKTERENGIVKHRYGKK